MIHEKRSLYALTIVAISATFGSSSAVAQVLHHWRFSSENHLLEDSVGNADLRIVLGNVEPVAVELKDEGQGAAFPASFDGIGGNSHAVMFSQELGGLQSDNVTEFSDDFTVESLVNLTNFDDGDSSVHIVAQTVPSLSAENFSWSFHVRAHSRSDRGEFGELVLVPNNSDVGSWEWIKSGIVLSEDTDYYLSGALDLDENLATFQAFDFAEKSLRTSTVSYRQGGMNTSPTILIGDIPSWRNGTGHLADGIIDEVRISAGSVAFEDSLLGTSTFENDQGVAIESITLAPRAIDRLRGGKVSDLTASGRLNLRSDAEVFAKFELPNFVDTEKLESAKLRFVLNEAVDDSEPVSVFHSVGDNDFEAEADGLRNQNYVDTSLDLFQAGSPVDEYVDLDVTDFVVEDFRLDGVSAFRLSTVADARYMLAMPRTVDQQPQLLLSFASEPVNGLIGDIDGDGRVGFPDFLILSDNFGMAGAADTGDLDGNGEVEFADFLILSENFGRGAAALDSKLASVPEPSSMLPLILAVAGLRQLWSRRKPPTSAQLSPSERQLFFSFR